MSGIAALPHWKLAYRIPEACAATGYKRSKLYQVIKEGKIAVIKDGSCTFILRSELERYLHSLESVPAAHAIATEKPRSRRITSSGQTALRRAA
jgi:excisionase family DNA binding protein